jgi:RHS repeat-associated protein
MTWEKDRDGIESEHAYDELKRRIETTRAGVTIKTVYDAESQVVKVTRIGSDNSEIVQQHDDFDLAGRLATTTNALNQQTSYSEIFANNEIVRTITLPDGVTTKISVSYLDGLEKKQGGAGNHPMKWVYGSEDGERYEKVINVGETGAETEWVKTFEDFAGRVTKIVYPDGAVELRSYNLRGQLASITDPDGVVTLYAYDGKGEQSMIAVDMNGNGAIDETGTDRISKTIRNFTIAHDKVVQSETTQTYAVEGSATLRTEKLMESSVDGLQFWNTVDGLVTHRAKIRTAPGAWTEDVTSPDESVTIFTYSNGQQTSQVQKSSVAGTQLGGVEFAYDAHGRLKKQTDSRNGAITFGYDNMDRLISTCQSSFDGVTAGQVTAVEYDESGRQRKITIPDGGEIVKEYYPTGELRKISGAQAYTVEYSYDPQGRRTTMTTTGQAGPAVTTWSYDSQRGWLKSKRDDSERGVDYAFTPAGRLATRTWERGVITNYVYDSAGTLISVDYSDATPDVVYTLDRLGRQAKIVDGSGTRVLVYTDEGQLDVETYTAGLLNGLGIDHEYDALNRRDMLSIRNGGTSIHAQSFAYGAASRLKSTGSGAYTVTYGYSPNSPMVETIDFKHSGATVMTTTKSYDFVNRLTSIRSVAGGVTVSNHTYSHSALNQRLRDEDADGKFWSYLYNSDGELESAVKHDALAAQLAGMNFQYSFDEIGNRTGTCVDGVANTTYVSNALNQYIAITGVSSVSPVHDADGNLTDNGELLFAYDGENRLAKVHRKSDGALIATYTYDDQSRRVRKVTTMSAPQGAHDRVFVWDGWNTIGELNHSAGGGSALRYYGWGLDLSGSQQGAGGVGGLVLEFDVPAGEMYLPTYDGNGNVMKLVKASDRSVAASYEYDPYGKVVGSTGAFATGNPWGFSTKYADAELGMLYYGFRYYSPGSGRWSSRDPIEEVGGVNLYAFVNNDPANMVDLFGMSPGNFEDGYQTDTYSCTRDVLRKQITMPKAFKAILANTTGLDDIKAYFAFEYKNCTGCCRDGRKNVRSWSGSASVSAEAQYNSFKKKMFGIDFKGGGYIRFGGGIDARGGYDGCGRKAFGGGCISITGEMGVLAEGTVKGWGAGLRVGGNVTVNVCLAGTSRSLKITAEGCAGPRARVFGKFGPNWEYFREWQHNFCSGKIKLGELKF